MNGYAIRTVAQFRVSRGSTDIVSPLNLYGVPKMSARSTITSHFEQVAAEQKRRLARLSDDLKLLDSGLDSLSFALVVMRLEQSLGFDPFDENDDVKFPVTFGEFVKLYERHPQ